MKVVVVESPAKAKTIEKYLGADFKVVASYGHVRDLPSKDGSVDVTNDFNMIWETSKESVKHVKVIQDLVKEADALYLATDPDREGEAIAWHVLELLSQKKTLKNISVKRIVFYEITKKAILEAVQNPRDINQDLVEAYLARRALDYLVGFSISPILWRKLPGSKSAGRVQSVALRLIVEREHEIEAFKSDEYWTIKGLFRGDAQKDFEAKLSHMDGKKLEKFSITKEKEAHAIVERAREGAYHVEAVEKKQTKRHPQPPFITSTLQQEASRKLGFGATKTMSTAQRLYEGVDVGGETVGLITYMRTDSISISEEALRACRSHIEKTYGTPYLPTSPRLFKKKVKNAQEAHEAIRPTDFGRTPQMMQAILSPEQWKLYDLIWKRAVASQMESALIDQVAVDLTRQDKAFIFRGTGSTIAFDGFLKLYEEGKDQDEQEEGKLPSLHEGEKVAVNTITPEQHFTQPPPRYTEATLVKKLEELGIGRPSTYASIIQVLQARSYVRLEKKVFFPEDRGFLVTAFLEDFFSQYVEYNFTATLEDQLDAIAETTETRKKVLSDFWKAFSATIDKTKELKVSDVLDVLNRKLARHLFGTEQAEEQKCPECKEGKLHLKLSKFGAFIGCDRYPECKYTQKLKNQQNDDGSPSEKGAPSQEKESLYPKVLGQDPHSKEDITLRKGPYGFYLQVGEAKGKEKPKRSPLPKTVDPQKLEFKEALRLLTLPLTLGTYPNTSHEIVVGIGRFGPYVKYDGQFYSIKKDDVLTLSLERAIEIIDEKKKK